MAIKQLERSVSDLRRFPSNVFKGAWCDFFFFDADWMFDADFVRTIQSLLNSEDSTCACLVCLDEPQQDAEKKFLIEKSTTPEDYRSTLAGDGYDSGWVYNTGRFAAISDTARWCIYCERQSEIAVIAFRSSECAKANAPVLKKLHAVRIAEAVENPSSYGFTAAALATEWRLQFLREYGSDKYRPVDGNEPSP